MGTPEDLELPARISSCLRLFIEKLFAEVDFEDDASWHPKHEVRSEFPKMIKKEYSKGLDDWLGVHRILIKN